MKKLLLTSSFLISCTCFSQFSGNVNYKTVNDFSQNTTVINPPRKGEIFVSVKGLANVVADQYVAIFSLTQTGKDQTEANRIIDERISESLKKIKTQKNVEVFTDMISFVPMYEFTSEKKLFSKRTYNEIPKGFEIKKNIHIKFSNPEQLNDLIKILAENEIFDLVRVDHYSTTLDEIKTEVATKAKKMLGEKVKSYEDLSGKTYINDEKTFSEGFIIKIPVEMYQSYEAYNSNSLDLKKSSEVSQVAKNKTIYYQPIFDKDLDFVLNPVVLQSVIQILYEVKMTINTKEKENKTYFINTSTGDLKQLQIEK